MAKQRTKLMEAYKKEKDGRMKTRLQAVCHVLEGGKSASEVAKLCLPAKILYAGGSKYTTILELVASATFHDQDGLQKFQEK